MRVFVGIFSFILGVCLLMRPAQAQTAGDLSTIAGGSLESNIAIHTNLSLPRRVIVDTTGNVYIADTSRHRVRKMAPDGTITTVAGNGIGVFFGDDSTATVASLSLPSGIVLDATGNLYIADTGNNRIRKVGTSGIITTVAGNGTAGFAGDGGQATSGNLNQPQDIAVDAAGNLYIADTANHLIRKVDTGGIITTVAGNGIVGFSGDGAQAISAGLNFPRSVTVDVAGNLYIGDTSNNRIRKVDAGGVITTVAGDGGADFSGDGGQAISAGLNLPRGVAISQTGVLYIADSENNRIRKIEANGTISTIVGNGNLLFAGDGGPATSARLSFPSAVAVDATGQYYIADTENSRIRRVDVNGNISTFAGTGSIAFTGDGGPAVDAGLNAPFDVAVDAAGRVYIVNSGDHRIRRVDTNGIISTVAGSHIIGGFSGDGGPATSARFDSPRSITIGRDGTLYLSDSRNHRIRKVDAAGIITTIAGSGQGFRGDGGAALTARFNLPSGIHVDGIDNLYIADSFNHRIRKISPDGIITTIAGDGFTNEFGEGRFNSDNVPALEASLNIPIDVAVDAIGQVYIADTGNHRIRKIDTQGMMTTVAGDGYRTTVGDGRFNGDGPAALSTSLFFPNGLALDGNRNIYIADTFNQRVRQVVGEGPAAPLSLSVSNFTITQVQGAVRVQWTLDQIPATFGFNIYRSLQPDTGFVKINPTLVTVATTSGYYTDPSALESDQTYYYLIETVDIAGNTTRIAPASVKIEAILTVELFQNAPNPFNPNTVIRYALPAPAKVTLRIYNILGQEIRVLLNRVAKVAGFDTVSWDGTNQNGKRVSSGVYFYHLSTDTGDNRFKRMLLLR